MLRWRWRGRLRVAGAALSLTHSLRVGRVQFSQSCRSGGAHRSLCVSRSATPAAASKGQILQRCCSAANGRPPREFFSHFFIAPNPLQVKVSTCVFSEEKIKIKCFAWEVVYSGRRFMCTGRKCTKEQVLCERLHQIYRTLDLLLAVLSSAWMLWKITLNFGAKSLKSTCFSFLTSSELVKWQAKCLGLRTLHYNLTTCLFGQRAIISTCQKWKILRFFAREFKFSMFRLAVKFFTVYSLNKDISDKNCILHEFSAWICSNIDQLVLVPVSLLYEFGIYVAFKSA